MINPMAFLIHQLKQLSTVDEVYSGYPSTEITVKPTFIIIDETENTDVFYDTNTSMEIVDLTYEINVYSDNMANLNFCINEVDTFMKDKGFIRTRSTLNLNNEPLFCRTMTYTCRCKKQNSDYVILYL